MWEHISKLYSEDLKRELKMLPRLSFGHIKLTPFSVMRMNLAAQILSKSVSLVLKNYCPPEVAGTALFCEMFDSFFACFNVRNIKQHTRKKKPFLAPYTTKDDMRFGWLENSMLGFLWKWKESKEKRPGNFCKGDKARMFIS